IRKWADFYALELERPELAVDLLTVNEYSRPGEELPEVKSIFIHYTANAGTTAEQNRSYFESLAESHERSASAHFVIGFDGTIVQCIPTKEIAYAVKGRNYDSISIECCYINENGKFESATYNSLIELTAWLLHKYELEPGDVLRHYDEGGKNCPKYYVEHEDAWNRFLGDLEIYMRNIS
ncbi:MAG: N-acetylmuramoyl-L-alanine amidase, partial [Kineothrix sp.]|nr:N-acetylmuramoyl-L-alanine amidase [Kineothrix sp.]